MEGKPAEPKTALLAGKRRCGCSHGHARLAFLAGGALTAGLGPDSLTPRARRGAHVCAALSSRAADTRREPPMDNVCLTIPLLPGQVETARSFLRALDGPRRAEYAESEQRIGIDKELWYISDLGEQQLLVAYMEAHDFGQALGMFSSSRDPFDMWFKAELAAATSLDLNDPPEMQLPELVSHYEAGVPAGA